MTFSPPDDVSDSFRRDAHLAQDLVQETMIEDVLCPPLAISTDSLRRLAHSDVQNDCT